MEYLNLLLSSVWLPNLIDRWDDGYAVSLLLELLAFDFGGTDAQCHA